MRCCFIYIYLVINIVFGIETPYTIVMYPGRTIDFLIGVVPS